MSERYEGATGKIRRAAPYAGIAGGAALQFYDSFAAAGRRVFNRTVDRWGIDHGAHLGFCWFMSGVTDDIVDTGSRYAAALLEQAADGVDRDVERYLNQAAEMTRDPTTRRYAAAFGTAATTFTLLKEGIVHVPVIPPALQDSTVELGDVAGNYAPMIRYTDVPDIVRRRVADEIEERDIDGWYGEMVDTADEQPADD